MRGLFYQANFCAECGNRLDRRRRWAASYFCAFCAARRRGRYLAPLVLILCGLALGLALSGGRRQTALDRLTTLGSAARESVSAQDATVRRTPARRAEPEQHAICGARTRRGTPCQHRTTAGERCAQHRGRPSMLAETGPNPAPARSPTP
jgi:hypothetical protein